MKNLRPILCLCLLLGNLFSERSAALEVDEKLTLRILKVSDSKKTILINRGIEDGLSVGDHAKFFLTSGVLARGVLVKASPSRSIWSLYRMIDEGKITTDLVMNLKIASAVKVTEDETKVVHEAPKTIGGKIEGSEIALAPGANDLEDLSHEEQKDFEKLEAVPGQKPIHERPWEIFGMGHFDTLRAETTGRTADIQDANLGGSGDNKSWGATIGFERYALVRNMWYSNFSLYPFFHYAQEEITSLSGRSINQTLWEGGLGLNYHFYNYPNEMKKLIAYGTVAVGGGRIDESSLLVTNTATLDVIYQGVERFASLGAGAKFYFTNLFGARAVVDYYRRYETYNADSLGNSYERTTDGMRIYLGLSYRF